MIYNGHMNTNCETCKVCGIIIKNYDHMVCYKCVSVNKHKCIECNAQQQYKKCVICIHKKNCIYCQKTGLMYYGDNIWSKCLFC